MLLFQEIFSFQCDIPNSKRKSLEFHVYQFGCLNKLDHLPDQVRCKNGSKKEAHRWFRPCPVQLSLPAEVVLLDGGQLHHQHLPTSSSRGCTRRPTPSFLSSSLFSIVLLQLASIVSSDLVTDTAASDRLVFVWRPPREVVCRRP